MMNTKPILVLKERVVGYYGSWVIKARVADYNTATTGRVRRCELFLEEVLVPGQPKQEVGFSLQDIQNMHDLLVKYSKMVNEDL